MPPGASVVDLLPPLVYSTRINLENPVFLVALIIMSSYCSPPFPSDVLRCGTAAHRFLPGARRLHGRPTPTLEPPDSDLVENPVEANPVFLVTLLSWPPPLPLRGEGTALPPGASTVDLLPPASDWGLSRKSCIRQSCILRYYFYHVVLLRPLLCWTPLPLPLMFFVTALPPTASSPASSALSVGST